MELSDSAEFILNVMRKDVLKNYEKIEMVSENYKEDGCTFEKIMEKFTSLSENIYLSMEDTMKKMNILIDIVDKSTKSSMDIACNIAQINKRNECAAQKSIKNSKASQKLLELVDKFN